MISTAYERSGVIVTTNLPFEQWSEVLGSERLTGVTLDRLMLRCSVIEVGGGELPAARRTPSSQGRTEGDRGGGGRPELDHRPTEGLA